MKMLTAFLLIPVIVGSFRHLHTDSWTAEVRDTAEEEQYDNKDDTNSFKPR